MIEAMRDRVLRVIEILLAGLGVFVTGTLSLAELLGRDAPCGDSNACQIVANSEYSRLFGVPIAYFGLLAYLVILAFNHQRQPGHAIAVIGTLVSGILLGISRSLDALCLWCAVSGGLMLALLLVKMPRPDFEDREPTWKLNLGVALLALIAAKVVVDIGPSKLADMEIVRNLPLDQLAPDEAPSIGDPNAKVLIVEFGDMSCAACRDGYQRVRRNMAEYSGIRLVYRHYPSRHNPNGHRDAVRAEIAHAAGRFWEFFDKAMASSPDAAWQAENLSATNADKEAEDRVQRAIMDGRRMGIRVRPVFIVVTPNGLRLTATNLDIDSVLASRTLRTHLTPR